MKTLIPEYQYLEAANYSSRRGYEQDGIVLHYTAAGNGLGTAKWAQNPACKVSWHFLITRGGDTVQQVPLDKAAWHAGKALWTYQGKEDVNVNAYTIGIELANHGPLIFKDSVFTYKLGDKSYRYEGPMPSVYEILDGSFRKKKTYWEPYYVPQIEALCLLIGKLKEEGYNTRLIGHEDVARPLGRKTDPGPVFPWSYIINQY